MLILSEIDTEASYTCGGLNFSFSGMIPQVVSTIIFLIKIIVPILLIIFGMIDFLKSVTASKEDEIKKGQQTFIKRLIAAALVFFIVQIVQLVVRFASGKDEKNIMNCFNCFANGDVGDNACKIADETSTSASPQVP